MLNPRRMIRTHILNSCAAADVSVREAENIVHDSWLRQLAERRQEMEAALERAAARCTRAEQALTEARLTGDPLKIATLSSDLDKALLAARKTLVAWERTCHVLSDEATTFRHQRAGHRREV